MTVLVVRNIMGKEGLFYEYVFLAASNKYYIIASHHVFLIC
jgi:hypothetical protein